MDERRGTKKQMDEGRKNIDLSSFVLANEVSGRPSSFVKGRPSSLVTGVT